jgi:hypothetical protein
VSSAAASPDRARWWALLGRVPAVDRDGLAGDERGAVGTEQEDGAGDLRWPARYARTPVGPVISTSRGVHVPSAGGVAARRLPWAVARHRQPPSREHIRCHAGPGPRIDQMACTQQELAARGGGNAGVGEGAAQGADENR